MSDAIIPTDGFNIRWWTLKFPDGSVSSGLADPEELWNRYGLPKDMKGLRFYDLGCWDGGTTFLATQKGATDVFGMDSYVWEMDERNYKNFLTAKDLIAPSVKHEFVEIESPSITPASKTTQFNSKHSKMLTNKLSIEQCASKHGQADIVLAAGILYHLIDPISFLKDLKLLVKKETGRVFITTWCTHDKKPIATLNHGWRGDTTNFWLLSVPCMEKLLELYGYKILNIRKVVDYEDTSSYSFESSIPE